MTSSFLVLAMLLITAEGTVFRSTRLGVTLLQSQLDIVSDEARQLFDSVMENMKDYSCAVGGSDCEALEADIEVEEKVVNQEAITEEDINNLEPENENLIDELDALLTIRNGLYMYMCEQEPDKCDALDKLASDISASED